MPTNPYYEFGSFRLEVNDEAVLKDGEIVAFGAGEVAILLRLIEKRGHVVGKLELSKLIRGDEAGHANDATVTRYVSRIRSKLGDTQRSNELSYIKTASGRGYIFCQDVFSGGSGPIAILPFKHFGVEKNGTDFGEVFAELLSRSLINLKQFPVIPCSQLENQNSDIADRQASANFVVSGSLLISGRRVLAILYIKRKDAELSLGSPSYRENQANILRSLELIAETSAADLCKIIAAGQGLAAVPHLDRGPRTRIRSRNEEAHRFYEDGWAFLNRRTPDALIDALSYFKKAVQKDPNFAEAHVGVADCNLLLGIFGSEVIPPRKAMPRAEKAALCALEIDETLAEAHASLGAVKFLYYRDWQASEAEFKAAIASNPEYATAHQFYAHDLALLGRTDDALDQIRTAQILRHSPIIDATVSRICFLGRRYDDAIEAAQYTIRRYRQFFLGYVHLGIVYKQIGRLSEAIEQLIRAGELGGTPEWENPAIVAELGHAFGLAGRKAEAERIITKLEAMRARHYVSPFCLAKVYMGLGDLTRVFDLLELTFRDRSAWLLTFNQDPSFDSIREQPRFQHLLKRIGLPPQ